MVTKAVFAALLLTLLTACCEKGRVKPAVAEDNKCNKVRIVAVTATATLMETLDDTKFRMLRDGVFGNVDDAFTFCDK